MARMEGAAWAGTDGSRFWGGWCACGRENPRTRRDSGWERDPGDRSSHGRTSGTCFGLGEDASRVGTVIERWGDGSYAADGFGDSRSRASARVGLG